MSNSIVTWEQFGKHIFYYDCWVMVEQKVYNVTDFLVEHPGGDAILLKYSGIDGTEKFEAVPHSEYAISLRNARYVGKIQSPQPPAGYLDQLAKKKKEIQKNKNKNKNRTIVRSDKIPKAEVALHKSEQSCWIILDNKVYDVTDYLEEHPGGVSKIMEFAGKDSTEAFMKQQHSQQASKIKDGYYIGELESSFNPLILVVLLAILLALGYVFLF